MRHKEEQNKKEFFQNTNSTPDSTMVHVPEWKRYMKSNMKRVGKQIGKLSCKNATDHVLLPKDQEEAFFMRYQRTVDWGSVSPVGNQDTIAPMRPGELKLQHLSSQTHQGTGSSSDDIVTDDLMKIKKNKGRKSAVANYDIDSYLDSHITVRELTKSSKSRLNVFGLVAIKISKRSISSESSKTATDETQFDDEYDLDSEDSMSSIGDSKSATKEPHDILGRISLKTASTQNKRSEIPEIC
eukprot:scaffold62017_cov51-Attheya_sp.AAC.5